MVAVVVVSVSVVVTSNEVDACAVVCSLASVTVEVGLAVRWDGSVEDIRADVYSLLALGVVTFTSRRRINGCHYRLQMLVQKVRGFLALV